MLCHLFYLKQSRINTGERPVLSEQFQYQDAFLYLLSFLLYTAIHDGDETINHQSYNLSIFKIHCTRLIWEK